MTRSNLSLAVAMVIAAGLPSLACAQAADDLDAVVVTATRTTTTVDQSLAAVEVITREQLETLQAPTLLEVLRARAGINVSNQGGAGKLTTLFMRGSESDHVLVLVDGVRVGSSTSGLVSFQDLPVEQIERIEIVRGPRSSLYGSDAIGGVIQIFTRKDDGALRVRAHAGVGSRRAREAGVGLGAGGARGWFGIDANWNRTEGFNACRGVGAPVFAGCFTTEPDRDGYENRSLSLRGGVRFGERATLDVRALEARGENDYDGRFVNRSDVVQQVLGAQFKWNATERLTLQATLGSNRDASDNFLGSVDQGDFDTRKDTASLQTDWAVAEGQLLTFGADWLRDRITSSTAYDDTRRSNRAAFVQYQGAFGAHDLQLAVRRDDNGQFGGKTTGSAAWGVDVGSGFRLTASWGTAFKAPTFNELYFPFFGNPALRPEASRTVEAGIAWRGEGHGVRLDVFETDVDDLIVYDASIFLPNNLDRARLRGAELQYDGTVAGVDVRASASWLDPENRAAGVNFGNDLPRRARETARLDLDRAFGDVRIGITGIAEGGRYDNVANTRRLGGFATLDLRAEYAFTPQWRLQARVGNLFDRQYETVEYYHQPGREWFLTVRYASGN